MAVISAIKPIHIHVDVWLNYRKIIINCLGIYLDCAVTRSIFKLDYAGKLLENCCGYPLCYHLVLTWWAGAAVKYHSQELVSKVVSRNPIADKCYWCHHMQSLRISLLLCSWDFFYNDLNELQSVAVLLIISLVCFWHWLCFKNHDLVCIPSSHPENIVFLVITSTF